MVSQIYMQVSQHILDTTNEFESLTLFTLDTTCHLLLLHAQGEL